ncbi:hypothetical protein [Vagococcus fluvialis]|uniref:Uncharacterized protein n=1 Tax=Vagococcus fluvialis TaxID=2738 RepID=A0A7X6I433_9ENTE|nr:hypothetical protein [Vagococcus fluvialis]NKC69081.1 hypothetical protein [Vagococcus fluvialis]
MNATEIYLHRVNAATSEIEIEDFDFLNVRKRVKVPKDVISEAEVALSNNDKNPVIMMFDKENKQFIHDQLYD